jgi:glycosyltransferase involved in cell wall biosynthesis
LNPDFSEEYKPELPSWRTTKGLIYYVLQLDRAESLMELSCVVPTLNSAETLDQTLLSLCTQRNVDVRILVVDSGSTDGTLEICQRWGVETCYAERGNIYRAINVGLRQCNSPWLAYLNSDDWLYPDSYARLITCAEAHKAEVVYGNSDYTDQAGRFVYSFVAAKPSQLMPLYRLGVPGINQPAVIFCNQIYHQLNGFNEQYYLNADNDFFLRALRNEIKFAHLPGPSVVCFRLHKNQLSQSKGDQLQTEFRQVFGQPSAIVKMRGSIVLARWRVINLPNYIIRILRASLFAGHIRLPRWTYE